MINLRLLTVLLSAALSGTTVAAQRPRTVMTLEQVFETAESHSVYLRSAAEAVREAELQKSVARAARLPEISGSLSASYIGDGFTVKRSLSDYQKAPIPHLGTGVSVDVSQPLYSGGAITKSIEMASLKSTAARYAEELQRDNIRFRLAGYYLDMYKTVNLREVVEGNIATARRMLADMQIRYEQGTALKNDITRYELLISNLGLAALKLDNTIGILNRELVSTAGMEEGTVVEPDSALLARALPVEAEPWWQAEAARLAPSLRLADTSAEISRTAEALAQADRRPKISLQARWTMDGPILVEIPPINRNLSYWFVGAGVSFNLSSLYKTNKKLSAAKAATARSLAERDAAREDIATAVHGDYVRYLEAYEELKTQQKSVELACSNYLTVAARYGSGMALITELLDAADAKIDAEQRLVNARINIIYYYYKLLFTSGKI